MSRSVIFILINVLLERYCGTGTTSECNCLSHTRVVKCVYKRLSFLIDILVIYLNEELGFDEGTTTALYHTIELLIFIFPIFMAILADSYYGLFNTLIWTSLILILANSVIAIGAIEILNLPRV